MGAPVPSSPYLFRVFSNTATQKNSVNGRAQWTYTNNAKTKNATKQSGFVQFGAV